ncbi:Dps family protein [Jonesia denitrificans]|uniref:Ferritin Dps family protein n=1 Tax=Jonesia denitrificans (strain ATCC 14870 / DSM 20603 / BCRC 15368 / CIP 55.134 / JCM 11481 / NBRC 15587 / NCTC 10816 / Prevot 55134) TaxID=471856 RepID=C7R2U1_JONDD|nr:DNA starvation/stationary phase protection protein [Jonesia denitrificans]ACV08563.1 Ferritin Dps family protein [Jonesia denitrificans DSM 20603]ASE07812.1 DNA starvation/stationary phase protection protein [Jonesia denitrificans]QXB42421.1 DNA starvation/stationary phase protection protein [Jonesia denitrificans]SQH20548.1 DNA protection during starvation protein [Jonesia denitrificans]
MASDMYANYTVPGLELADGHKVADTLQMRIHALNDLQLTLKHAHWNVVGRDFISVHEMLDPQIDQVRAMVDALAERMATLGVAPNGLPGDLTAKRTWHDYPIGRATTSEHLAALDVVYNGVISDHRAALELVSDLDPITEDILISQTGELELFQWFMRSHLENPSGELLTENIESAKEAAAAARRVN